MMEDDLAGPAGDIRNRRLLMVAAALGKNITELWDVYQTLAEGLDFSEPENSDFFSEVLAEFEHNLVHVLDEVTDALYFMSGVWEPIPVFEHGDLESEVLRDLSMLDETNLEDFRIEYDD